MSNVTACSHTVPRKALIKRISLVYNTYDEEIRLCSCCLLGYTYMPVLIQQLITKYTDLFGCAVNIVNGAELSITYITMVLIGHQFDGIKHQ